MNNNYRRLRDVVYSLESMRAVDRKQGINEAWPYKSPCPISRASVCYSTIYAQKVRQQSHNLHWHCVNLSSIMADTNKGCINTSAVKSSTGCVLTMLRISCIVSVSNYQCMLIRRMSLNAGHNNRPYDNGRTSDIFRTNRPNVLSFTCLSIHFFRSTVAIIRA